MKKIISLVLVLLLFPALAMAEINLSSMTNDELIQLKTQILDELLTRSEIKEVKVPAGEYTVGEDIPAGNYTVYADSAACMLTVNEYEALHYLGEGNHIGKLVLKDGDVVNIVGSCIFTVYQGLGF